jgi:hypothetical protein
LCLRSRKCISVSNKTKIEYFVILNHITSQTF